MIAWDTFLPPSWYYCHHTMKKCKLLCWSDIFESDEDEIKLHYPSMTYCYSDDDAEVRKDDYSSTEKFFDCNNSYSTIDDDDHHYNDNISLCHPKNVVVPYHDDEDYYRDNHHSNSDCCCSSVTWVHPHDPEECCHYSEDTKQLIVLKKPDEKTKEIIPMLKQSIYEVKEEVEEELNRFGRICNNNSCLIAKKNLDEVIPNRVDSLEEILGGAHSITTNSKEEEEEYPKDRVVKPKEVPILNEFSASSLSSQMRQKRQDVSSKRVLSHSTMKTTELSSAFGLLSDSGKQEQRKPSTKRKLSEIILQYPEKDKVKSPLVKRPNKVEGKSKTKFTATNNYADKNKRSTTQDDKFISNKSNDIDFSKIDALLEKSVAQLKIKRVLDNDLFEDIGDLVNNDLEYISWNDLIIPPLLNDDDSWWENTTSPFFE